MTRQRVAVSDLLEDTADFRSAQQLHEMLRERGERVALATVYRTLQTLAEAGQVDVLRADDGESLYRRCFTSTHHHHLVCRRCGKAIEIASDSVETWAAAMAAEHGFTDVDHTFDFFGLCPTCSAARPGPGASTSAPPA
ncbi:MAG TPA: Fur family transcriptional regulator [Actinomycetaceae bacterium]|nr:Fur family transcriptional regulator [Actinomycetaceae bacterium]